MLSDLPFYIPLLFIFTTLLTFLFLIAAIQVNNPGKRIVRVSVIVICWLLLQAILGYKGFYTVTDTMPLRFALLVLPPFLFILILFLTSAGRKLLTVSP